MMRARYTNRKNTRKILLHVLSHKIVPILNKVPFPYFQQLVWLVLEIKMEIDI